MELHKFTKEEFAKLPLDMFGRKQCPKGDYSAITSFPRSKFEDGCIFSDASIFDSGCIFGDSCSFGAFCTFGNYCEFGKQCYFAYAAVIGHYCTLQDQCQIGHKSIFGHVCKFGKELVLESVGKIKEGNPFIIIDRIGPNEETIYFINEVDGIGVRIQEYYGFIEGYEDKIKRRYPEKDNKFRKQYMAAIKLAKVTFEDNK